MAFGWIDDVLGITGTILSLGVAGPAGVAVGVGLSAASKKLHDREIKINVEREEMIRRWIEFASTIAKLDSLTNGMRGKMLRETIRIDLVAKKGKLPKEREVNMYAELIVSAMKGSFDVTEGKA